MPKHLSPLTPKRKSQAKPEINIKHQAMLAKQRLKFIRGLKDASYRHIDSYSDSEIDKLIDGIYECVLSNIELIWYRDYLAKLGIHADRLAALRIKHPKLDDTIKICDAILEGRLINIPSHKAAHQRHSEFLLKKYIGGIWSDQRSVSVDLSNTSIFNRLDTSPIIAIKHDQHELASYEIIDINSNLI